VTCSQCHQTNSPDAKFCTACGARLDAGCSACGHVNAPDSRFCNQCGGRLGAAEPPPRMNAQVADADTLPGDDQLPMTEGEEWYRGQLRQDRQLTASGRKNLMRFLILVAIVVGLVFVIGTIGQLTSPREPSSTRNPTPAVPPVASTPSTTQPSSPDNLTRMTVAFEGNYTREQIKERLERAMILYNMEDSQH
jgi:Double zinc ribbon